MPGREKTKPRGAIWHHQAPRWRWAPTAQDAPRGASRLVRRGVEHGFLWRSSKMPTVANVQSRWVRDEPVLLSAALDVESVRGGIRNTLDFFRRVRRGGVLEPTLRHRLGGQAGYELVGVSVDVGDEREIEKVHVDSRAAEDLFAKLSWVSNDETDSSLRVRFSFGSERLDDWYGDDQRAREADRLAAAVFPECAAFDGHRSLRRLLTRLVGSGMRMSERIVYSNAPGGGAVFHHDAEMDQRGVVYGQLAGRTLWLALPKRALSDLVAKRGQSAGEALRQLDQPSAALRRRLNSDPRFTATLVEAGHAYVLTPGDVLLLPSRGVDDVAWHSVFALGNSPSLSHSYGLFAES